MEIQVPVADLKDTVIPIAVSAIDSTFRSRYIDLVSAPLGTQVLACSDEWFADAKNLMTPGPAVRKAGVFTHAGAWFDGWETRRHNKKPFDWVVFKLGVASGKVAGVEIDTAYFDGNHAPEAAVEGAFLPNDDSADEKVKDEAFSGWETILPKQECGPSQRQAWELPQLTEKAYTHVRLLMYPDGGIARFRLFGIVQPVFPPDASTIFDLAATVNGGLAVSCSDQHFGTKENLLLPGRGKDMGDGWETKRTRGEHVDWAIIRLGTPGVIEKLIIDTAHFRGNFPQQFQIFAHPDVSSIPSHDDAKWVEILAPQSAGPDKEHEFEGAQLSNVADVSYAFVKLVIIPDGGVKRIRVFGRRSA